jgi:diketogulonate reductase-like aldo/keto reductase
MILQENYVLSNGVAIPKLGFGTWRIDDDKVAEVVRAALEVGYRHIDTAQAYQNERGVGEGIRTSGLAREELFVTTKLDASIKTYHGAKSAIDGSFEALGLDYIDLLLIHSPQPWTEFREGEHFFDGNLAAWRALEEAYDAGRLRAIGVSNFEQVDLDNILTNGSVKPQVNQILAHVSNTPIDLIDYSKKNDILVEAYSPVAHGKILDNPELVAMARKYSVTPAQLSLRYCLQLGVLPLPKSVNPEHLRTNALLDFDISDADFETLKTIERIKNYGDASGFPVFGGRLNADGTLTARN